MMAHSTIMQTIVQEDKRGRVMSFYTLCFTGLAPFGSLIAGALASRIGAPVTVIIAGILCLLIGVWFSTRLPEIRRMVRPGPTRSGGIAPMNTRAPGSMHACRSASNVGSPLIHVKREPSG